ncbi:hypothetical protein GCM10008940_13800 [Microbulbifer agarilyticus]
MDIEMAIDQMRGGGPGTQRGTALLRGNHIGMSGETEIIIAAEGNQGAAIHLSHRARCGGEDFVLAVQLLRPAFRQARIEKVLQAIYNCGHSNN